MDDPVLGAGAIPMEGEAVAVFGRRDGGDRLWQ